MLKKKDLTRAARRAGAAAEEEVRIIFPFSLTRDSGVNCNNPVKGVAGATEEYVFSVEDEKIVLKEKLSDVEEFSLFSGSGCVFINVLFKDGREAILSRGNNSHRKAFTSALAELNSALRGTFKDETTEYVIGNSCPICGMPYLPGTTKCNSCSNKKSLILRMLKIASPWKWTIIFSITLYFVSSGVELIPPYLNRIMVDDYLKAANPVIAGFVGVVFSIFLIDILMRGIQVLRKLLMINTSAGLIQRLRQMTFDKVESLSIARVSSRTSGVLINTVSSDTETISSFLSDDLGYMIKMFVTLIVVSILLFVYDWRIALLILCPVPLIIGANRIVGNFMRRFHIRAWFAQSRASTVLHDILSGIRVVKSYGTEKKEVDRHTEATRANRDVTIETETLNGGIMPVLSFLASIGEFFLMYYVGNKILDGVMTIGEMVQFSSYVSIIYTPLRWMSSIPRILARVTTSATKIFEILDEESDVTDKEDAIDLDIDGEIEFDDVAFAYDPAAPVLKHVSATIKKGEMVGIVGRSGVGKSTFINLVMRMYDPDSGVIKIDGHDLRDIDQHSLRSQIGVVLQDTFLFSGSVYDNIRYAKPSATTEEVMAAAKLAGAHKFIVKLPDGYDTKIGERGFTISGGERQRVSIARALLRNPKILILDEATSALDTETEKEVQDVLYKLTRDRTTLAIAHRLSTLRNADKILVLDRGSVAEYGSHEELMKKGGIYYGLVMAQRQMSRIKKN
ncbi:MAG: ABC transporter ATP-binding protein/permease [Clostridia bacterium]|nr:ABC transporter ATP-binding protein/permease [Clostridia bacterium]